MYNQSSELNWDNNNNMPSDECGTSASAACSSRRVNRYRLVDDSPKSEKWKLSSHSPHKPLPQEPATPPKKKKALPAIPVQHYELQQPVYYEQQPLYDDVYSNPTYYRQQLLHNDAYSNSLYYSPIEPMILQEELMMLQEYYYDSQQQYDIVAPLSPSPVDFFPQQQHQITDYYQVPIPPQQPMENYYPYSPESSVIEESEEAKPTEADSTGSMPLQQKQEETIKLKKPDAVPFQDNDDKNIRQITVRSINDDYRVWITVEPKETGESIAEKIHTIATFRTQRILTVTTASGRKIALNKTSVFKHWQDMDDFVNGETWSVTYGPLKKSIVDKILY